MNRISPVIFMLSLAADIAVLKAMPRSKSAFPRALASFTGERGEQCRKIVRQS
jgi:hypothetical protein